MAHEYSVDTVNQRLLFDFPAVKTEVGVLLGARSVSGTLARHAATQIRKGMFEKVILSGGLKVFQPEVACVLAVNGLGAAVRDYPDDFFSRMTEAAYMRQVLVKEEGIPEDLIVFIDDNSKNTGHKFNLLEEKGVLANFNSVALVAPAYEQRRTIGTARMHTAFNHIVFVPQQVYPFGLTKGNWDRFGIRGFVLGEMAKTDPDHPETYVGTFCKDPDIERERDRALAYARSSGPA